MYYFLIALFVPAFLIAEIAVHKGYSFFSWFVFGLFLNIIAAAVIIWKPNLYRMKVEYSTKKCPHCNGKMKEGEFLCTTCAHDDLFEADYNFDY